MIESLQSGARDAVQVMQASRSQAESSVEQAAKAGPSLEVINSAVAEISELNSQIASASTEQNTVVEEINRKIDEAYNRLENLEGEDAKLVEYLKHPVLAVRVLSFWNLKEITGLGLFYKPEHTEAKRKTSIAKWEERLASGDIRYKQAETPKPATEGVAEEPMPDGDQPPL